MKTTIHYMKKKSPAKFSVVKFLHLIQVLNSLINFSNVCHPKQIQLQKFSKEETLKSRQQQQKNPTKETCLIFPLIVGCFAE